jgi:hypothetical protein
MYSVGLTQPPATPQSQDETTSLEFAVFAERLNFPGPNVYVPIFVFFFGFLFEKE